jgi:hypothetical protein
VAEVQTIRRVVHEEDGIRVSAELDGDKERVNIAVAHTLDPRRYRDRVTGEVVEEPRWRWRGIYIHSLDAGRKIGHLLPYIIDRLEAEKKT